MVEVRLSKEEIEKIQEEKIPYYLKIENKPTLFEINQSFNFLNSEDGKHQGIKGEDKPRMVVFTNFILGRKHVLLKASRASGKTAIISVVSQFCKKPIRVSNASEKADIRDFNINEASHFIIPEINKLSASFKEGLKDIGEGQSFTYKTLDDYKVAKVFTIYPKPFISSIADENKGIDALGEELISRLTTISLDTSTKQNIDVIEDKLYRAQNPFRKQEMSNARLDELKKYVKSLPNIENFNFVYLPGKAIRKAIPPIFTDSRRDIEKYLHNTYAIALFHFADRMVFEKNKKKHVLVTPADVWYNHVIFNDVLLKSALKCNDIEKKILQILKNTAEKKVFGLKDIYIALLEMSIRPTLNTVKKYCENLYENGYIIINDDVKPTTYEINSEFANEYKVEIDWKEIVNECKKSIRESFPEVADEYIKRFCEKIMVKDPFTGEETDIFVDKSAKSEESAVKVENKETIVLSVLKTPISFSNLLTQLQDKITLEELEEIIEKLKVKQLVIEENELLRRI